MPALDPATSPKRVDPSVPSLEYLAGILDGEGHFGLIINYAALKKQKGRNRQIKSEEASMSTRLVVTSTHYDLVKALQEAFGGKVYNNRGRISTKHKFQWAWMLIKQQEVLDCLLQVERLLRTKRPQAEALLLFLQTKKHTRKKRQPLSDDLKKIRRLCYNKIKQANAGLWDNLNVPQVGHGVHDAAI